MFGGQFRLLRGQFTEQVDNRRLHRGDPITQNQCVFRHGVGDPQQCPQVASLGHDMVQPLQARVRLSVGGEILRGADDGADCAGRVALPGAGDDRRQLVRRPTVRAELAEEKSLPHDIGANRVGAAGPWQRLGQQRRQSVGGRNRGELHCRAFLADQRAYRGPVRAALQREAGSEVQNGRGGGLGVAAPAPRQAPEPGGLTVRDAVGEVGAAERQRLRDARGHPDQPGHQQKQRFGFQHRVAQPPVEIRVQTGRRDRRGGPVQYGGGHIDRLAQQRAAVGRGVQRRQRDRFGGRRQILRPSPGQATGTHEVGPPAQRRIGMAFQQ